MTGRYDSDYVARLPEGPGTLRPGHAGRGCRSSASSGGRAQSLNQPAAAS